jgi:hypothetical protein
VMLFVQQDLLEQLARAVVAHVRGRLGWLHSTASFNSRRISSLPRMPRL